jgi:hypothetical protein
MGALDIRCIYRARSLPLHCLNDRSHANQPGWGLVRRRECLLPTLRGWILLLLMGLLSVSAGLRIVHPFLAVTDPLPGGVLVVEGWVTDYAFEQAIAEFRKYNSRKLYVTGGPLDRGMPLSEYKTYAELGAATLVRLGLDKNAVQAVPAPWMRQDRTYASAIALRNWLRQHNAMPAQVNVITVGAHARRSRLLFEKAFAGDLRVGIVAIEDRAYDAKRWWTSSNGVRAVFGEMLAYGYARLFFHAPTDPGIAPTNR